MSFHCVECENGECAACCDGDGNRHACDQPVDSAPTPHAFKVGDRVRVIAPGWGDDGLKGTITDLDPDPPLWGVRLDTNQLTEFEWYADSELEALEATGGGFSANANLNWRERRMQMRKAADDHATHIAAHIEARETIMQEAQRDIAEAQRQIAEARGELEYPPQTPATPEQIEELAAAHPDYVPAQAALAAMSVTYLDGVRVTGDIGQRTATWIEIDGKRRYGRVETVDGEGRVVREEREMVASKRRWA